jgi:hypothetical protein
VSDDKTQGLNQDSRIMAQIGMLNLRINDMMIQLNTVIKSLIDENTAIKKDCNELKSKQEKVSEL